MVPHGAEFTQQPSSIEVGDEDGDSWFKTNHRFAERPAFSVEIAYLDGEPQPPSHRSSRKS